MPVAVSSVMILRDCRVATALSGGKAAQKEQVRRPAFAVAYSADAFGKKSSLADIYELLVYGRVDVYFLPLSR